MMDGMKKNGEPFSLLVSRYSFQNYFYYYYNSVFCHALLPGFFNFKQFYFQRCNFTFFTSKFLLTHLPSIL